MEFTPSAIQKETSKVRHCGKILQRADWFGMPITLQYKHMNSYKTSFGGLMSLSSALIIIGYFIAQLKRIIDQESTFRQSSFYRDTYTDNTTYHFDQSNYDIAISLVNNIPYFDTKITEQYVIPQYYNMKFYFEGALWKYEDTKKHLRPCTEDRFLGNQDVLEQWEILDGFLCPLDFELELKGFLGSKESSQAIIFIEKCTQEDLDKLYPDDNLTCKSDEEIEFYLSQLEYQVIFYNQYFDLSDFTDGFIKENMRAYKGFIHSQVHQLRQVYISQNNAVNYNSWYGFGSQNVETTFVSTKFELMQATGMDNVKFPDRYVTIIIYMDPEIKTIQRARVTIIDVLSKTGGILGIVFGFLQMALFFYQRASLFLELINISFKFEDFSTKKGKININAANKQELVHVSHQNMQPDSPPLTREQGQVEQSVSESIQKFMKGVNLNLNSVKILLRGMLPCPNSKQFKLYKSARNKVFDELDIFNVLRQIRMARVMTKLLLSKSQRELIRYSKEFYISQKDCTNLKNNPISETMKIKNEEEPFKDIQTRIRKVIIASAESTLDKKILKNLASLEHEDANVSKLHLEGQNGCDPVDHFDHRDFDEEQLDHDERDHGKSRKMGKQKTKMQDFHADSQAHHDKPHEKVLDIIHHDHVHAHDKIHEKAHAKSKKKQHKHGTSRLRKGESSDPDNSWRELKLNYVEKSKTHKGKADQPAHDEDKDQ